MAMVEWAILVLHNQSYYTDATALNIWHNILKCYVLVVKMLSSLRTCPLHSVNITGLVSSDIKWKKKQIDNCNLF